MREQYIAAAVEQATCEYLSDEEAYYCEVATLPGVWATGDTQDAALDELGTVIEGWVALGLKMKHQIPILNGIDLNYERP